MPVIFYLPEQYLPEPARQEAWKEGRMHALEVAGKIASVQSWIYQTWVELRRAGVEVELSAQIPPEGVVVAFGGTLGREYRAPKGVFLVDVVADGVPHAAGHRHIVQNRAHAARLPGAIFMPHWPQPGLIGREASRGDVFETVAFFGAPGNVVPDLGERLWSECGLLFETRGADRWHDYAAVDCVLAVRDFGSRKHLHKPATKLYNAWLAGVPFVGGRESAYLSDGRSGKDCLLAGTVDELWRCLRELRDSPERRQALVAEGRERGKEFCAAATVERWKGLVEEELPRRAEEERKKTSLRREVEYLIRQGVAGWDRRFRS